MISEIKEFRKEKEKKKRRRKKNCFRIMNKIPHFDDVNTCKQNTNQHFYLLTLPTNYNKLMDILVF